MTYPKGHVIRLMKTSASGRNVTSLQSKFQYLIQFTSYSSLMFNNFNRASTEDISDTRNLISSHDSMIATEVLSTEDILHYTAHGNIQSHIF